MTTSSQLQHLRDLSAVDCDTLDVSVARALGPFVDCTSNQAIALAELQKPINEPVLVQAAKIALRQPDASPTIVGDIASCLLSARILPHLTGYIHTQTNPCNAFSTSATVADARRIISIYATLSQPVPKERVCIKIPSTWEGLMACKKLEAEGIRTLATTLFTLEQAKMAARVGCTYVAPYVNALRVHFEAGFIDAHPGFDVTVRAQQWYEATGAKTQVLAASFTNVDEVLKLRGLRHLTVSPPLLAAMAATQWGDKPGLIATTAADMKKTMMGDLVDEAQWRLMVNRESGGWGAQKLVDAINIFCEVQEKLESLCAEVLKKARAEV